MSDFEDRLSDALAEGAEDAPDAGGLAAAARTRAGGRRRRRVAVGAAAAVVAVLVPVAVVASLDDDPSPDEPPADRTAETLVTCGGASWPVSAMDGGLTEVAADVEVRAAVEALPAQLGIDSPDVSRWIVLAADDDGVTIGTGTWSSAAGPARRAETVEFDRADDGTLDYAGLGGCQLSVVRPPGRWQVELSAPGAGVDPTTDRPVVLATERECASGRDPRPYLSDPVVVETDDRVVVTITSHGDGNYTCVDNPSVPVTLDLDEPLGDREIVDGGTWPQTPLPVVEDRVEEPWQTVEHAGVAVDVPANWTTETAGCGPDAVARGPRAKGRDRTCDTLVSVTSEGAADGSDGLFGASADVVVGDRLVGVQTVDFGTTRRIAASARPVGEPTPAVAEWRTVHLDATFVVDVPVGAGVDVAVRPGIARCDPRGSAAEPTADGRWQAGSCADRLVTVTAPTEVLANLVVGSIRRSDLPAGAWQVAVVRDVLVELPSDWTTPPACGGLGADAPLWGPADGADDCRATPGVFRYAAATFDPAFDPGVQECEGAYCGYQVVGDAVIVVREVDEATARRVLDSATPT
ncbi:hypothetical protein [Nocardioides sp. 1609]|uniref:hypothetical protein n=1 Tax=Nocardioides sp. 1609 TaxID=2508327 RepID=UPI0010704ECE|nr:hypothetical protein [Nocardioides sp. 1609]